VALPEDTPLPAAEQRLAVLDRDVLGARLDADIGVERTPHLLARAVADLPEPEAPATSDLVLAALIARAAFLRRESRGAHFRTDFPESRPEWRGRVHWRRGKAPRFEEVLA
jgi:aspartate oxidase